jgi:hypothetical protein
MSVAINEQCLDEVMLDCEEIGEAYNFSVYSAPNFMTGLKNAQYSIR